MKGFFFTERRVCVCVHPHSFPNKKWAENSQNWTGEQRQQKRTSIYSTRDVLGKAPMQTVGYRSTHRTNFNYYSGQGITSSLTSMEMKNPAKLPETQPLKWCEEATKLHAFIFFHIHSNMTQFFQQE